MRIPPPTCPQARQERPEPVCTPHMYQAFPAKGRAWLHGCRRRPRLCRVRRAGALQRERLRSPGRGHAGLSDGTAPPVRQCRRVKLRQAGAERPQQRASHPFQPAGGKPAGGRTPRLPAPVRAGLRQFGRAIKKGATLLEGSAFVDSLKWWAWRDSNSRHTGS